MKSEDRPAHDNYVERVLLASLMLDPGLLVGLFPPLEDEDFHDATYRMVYQAIRAISWSGRRADAPAVADELARRGPDGVGDPVGLVEEILGSVSHGGNGRYYAEIARMKRIEREIVACRDRAE